MDAEEVFNYCLNEVRAGRTTPGECARRFPDVPDLEAQLRLAIRLSQAPLPEMRPSASRALEARLRQAARNSRRPKPRHTWRWATALAMVVILAMGLSGTVAAAGSSLPGDWLYSVKRAAEAVRIGLSPPAGQPALHAGLAEERAGELLALVAAGRAESGETDQLAEEMAAETALALQLVGLVPAGVQAGALESIQSSAQHQIEVLQSVQGRVPQAAEAGIATALAAAQANHGQAIARLAEIESQAAPEASSPPGQTRVPPGQTQAPPGQTRVPPGQTKLAPSQTHVPPGQTQVPPGQTRVPPGQTQIPPGQSQIPPGQASKTETPTPKPTATPHPTNENQGGPPGEPNCAAGNPNSPNFCTPTPGLGAEAAAGENTASPTACPTHAGGRPKCN